MTDPTLLSLAQIVLPCEVLESFDIVKVESKETEIHIHLDEKLYETLRKDVHFESKGFIGSPDISWGGNFIHVLGISIATITGLYRLES